MATRTMRYPVVLFDLDHTLLDSHASEQAAFDATMRSIGVTPSTDVFDTYDRINQALWRQVERGELSPNDVKVRRFEHLLVELDRLGDPEELGATFVTGLTDHGDVYPGVYDLMSALHGNVRLAIVTNGIGAVQRGRLERLDLARYFEVVSVSGELGMSKPAPAIFDHTLAELGVTDRSTVVMVGDSLASDVAGGINARIDTIWFNRGASQPASTSPTLEATSIEAVVALLTG